MSLVKAKQLEGVHANQLLDNLITAIVDPTISQDISQGYKPSSIWVNVNASPHKVFICSDNSIGAAVWIEIKELPVAPSSTPLGYNDIRTSFTGANWSYEGLTNNGGGISLSGSIAVSGAAGWRYLVVDTLAAVSVETIPPAEIVADTQQFTPAPIFNVSNNGYYSSVNTTKRIIAIGYFDGVNLLETISYGNGSKKNDDYWRNAVIGTEALSSAGERLRFTDAMLYSRGSNVTIVDNGYGSTDAYGCKITNLENSPITINGAIEITTIGAGINATISVNKNGATFIDKIAGCFLTGVNSSTLVPFSIIDKHAQKDDYYTFVIALISGGTATMINIEVTK